MDASGIAQIERLIITGAKGRLKKPLRTVIQRTGVQNDDGGPAMQRRRRNSS
jgi:hypothetical protein